MKTGTKIITLDNGYHLWTNTQGEGDIHLLALHGGPGGNHEYWEDAAEQLKKQGLNVQVTMYDQLGSLYSDQPDYSDPEIAKKYLTYEYFLDEVFHQWLMRLMNMLIQLTEEDKRFFHKLKLTLCTNVKRIMITIINAIKMMCKF